MIKIKNVVSCKITEYSVTMQMLLPDGKYKVFEPFTTQTRSINSSLRQGVRIYGIQHKDWNKCYITDITARTRIYSMPKEEFILQATINK